MAENSEQFAYGPHATDIVERQVFLDVVAVAATISLLHHVAGVGEVDDDPVDGSLGDAEVLAQVAQPRIGLIGDEQQRPSVIGEEVPSGHRKQDIIFQKVIASNGMLE